MKRLIDLVLAVFLLIIFSALIIVLAIIVKLTSPGPVIFTQKRIGKGGRVFNIYKFRTMYATCPGDVATHLLQDAQNHITTVGNFLRKSSLDELPQLINIIKGDMSFVGPRPSLYNQYDLIGLREEYGIHAVRPGLTGWAQINGRDEVLVEEKALLDKYYITHMSLWLDFKIMFITIFRVIAGVGIVEGKRTINSNEGKE